MEEKIKQKRKFLGEKAGKFLGKKTGRRISIIAAATLAVAGGMVGIAHYNQKDDSYQLAQANDILDDEYDNKIPIILDNGSTSFIDKDEFIIVDDKIKKGKNNVTYISAYNEIMQGQIDSKYLKESKFTISEDLLKEYKYVYRTIPNEGANLRAKPTIDDSPIVSTLGKDEFVLASTKYVAVNDGFSWIPVIKINQYGVYQGYVRDDLLEKEGTIENGKFDEKALNTMANLEKDSETSKVESSEVNNEITTTEQKQEESYEINQDDYIKNINKIVNTDVDNKTPLNCRIMPSIEADVITSIPSGSEITATGNRATNEGREWIEIIFKQGNEETKGWVAENYLEDIIVEKKVDTSIDKVDKLNMRSEPGLDSEVIMEIESNKNIKILKQNFNNPIECDGYSWIKVKVNDQIGYIASKYLKDIERDVNTTNESQNMEIYQNIINNIEKNESGKLTGIDVAFATGDKIEVMAKKGINQDKVATEYMGILNNVSDITSSKVNFVMIGIGAMNDDCNVINDRKTAMECIKKCEEMGIPYGLYYYSGCINKEEAQKEYNYITSFMESLKSINPKYNLMPLALDVEINNVNVNRQAGNDVTEVKAYLANLLQEDNRNIILYTAQNAASITDEINGKQCISIPKFKKMTGIDHFWYVAPKQECFNSDISEDCKKFIENTPQDINIDMQQVILDGNINGINVDVDVMEEEFFKECIRKSLNIDDIEQNIEINEDEER